MKLPVKLKHPVEPVPGTKMTGGFWPWVNVLGIWMAARNSDSVTEYGASLAPFLG
jgi:hypothetical protein